MKIAYLHNLPLEYYPPATNTLDLLGREKKSEVCAYTTHNRKNRKAYKNKAVTVYRSHSPNPESNFLWRAGVALWWHLRTAVSMWAFKPDAIIYFEPHSAIAAYLYYRFFRGNARLFIHHHEYYAPEDYLRPGMRLPHLGCRLEQSYLFRHAAWISQTNEDRLRLAKEHHPKVPDDVWRTLPNYPPKDWCSKEKRTDAAKKEGRLRLIYVGSASFQDTYIREIVRWVASHPDTVLLHISGYNVAQDAWEWLEKERFPNVTFDANGYEYDELPNILVDFDIGLVLYKGNTTNFVYNVPNKVFEYLACGLDVWYPKEMKGMRNMDWGGINKPLEIDFQLLTSHHSINYPPRARNAHLKPDFPFSAENALLPLLDELGIY